MNLDILTPEKTLFSDDVFGIQLPGVAGLFEVLDKHAPLISALRAGRIKVLENKNKELAFFDIQSGFVEVLANTVTVLVEGAVPVETK
jgi:F-type H+-transporting ATPase subunit epsilon